jgi:hypothetical protein
MSAALERWRPRPAGLALVDDGSVPASLSLEKYRSPAMLGIFASNLLLLWGVTFGGWSLFSLFLVVWFENVIVVAHTLLRLLLERPGNLELWGRKVFYGFICLNLFGWFALLQLGPIYVLFSGEVPGLKFFQAPPAEAMNAALAAEMLDLLPQIVALAAFRLVPLFAYILKGEYHGAQPAELLLKIPMYRFILLQLSVNVCGQAAISFGTPLPMVVALLLIKFAWEWATEYDRNRGARGVSR